MEDAIQHSAKRILVATTDPDMQKALKMQLRGRHFDSFFVSKGIDAVLTILEKEWDLVILELDMNGFVGVDLLPVMRKLRPRLPIILITEDFTSQVRKVAAEQGMTFQTFKPKNYSETQAIIKATEKIIEKRELIKANL